MGRIILLLFCILCAGCANGPDAERLQSDLQARLDRVFGAGTVQVLKLERRGSAVDGKAPHNEERRVQYFDARIKLSSDRDFSAWDSPGVGTLVTLVGAGPRGIDGIRGNGAGEVINVHGSLVYRKSDGKWEEVMPKGFNRNKVPEIGQGDSQKRWDLLVSAMTTALNLTPYGTGKQDLGIIKDEMERAFNVIQGRLTRLHQGVPLAAGPDYGQYGRFAKAYGKLLGRNGVQVTPLSTDGGLENIKMLRRGDAVLALSQGDVSLQAAKGVGPFAGDGPYDGLRALASLYPEPVHVITLPGGPKTVRDLAGKRVGIGLPESASQGTALAVLEAHGISRDQLAEAAEVDLPAALAGLRDGKLDAVIQVIGAPADQIRSANEDLDLQLLPLDAEAIDRLVQSRPGTFAFNLPAGSYSKQTEPIPTVAVGSLLLGDRSLSPGEAEQLVRLLFDGKQDWAAAGSIQGAQLLKANAHRGVAIPMHEGAISFLQAPESSPDESGKPAQ